MTDTYRKHPDLRVTQVEDEGVVLHLGSRRYFSVSESGLILLNALEESRSLDELVEALCDEYEVTESEARQSTREFIDRCLDAKLLIVNE